MISVNRLRNRKSDFKVNEWMLDSGAFTELSRFGHYRHSVQEYADCIKRWRTCGNLLAAVPQDWMLEPFIREKTGLSIRDHQRLTIERYDELLACDTGVYILPVLQGYQSEEYVSHLHQYGDRLRAGHGSVLDLSASGTASLSRSGTTCMHNVEMIEMDDKTIRLEERQPGQLPAPVKAEQREPPLSRDRKDTFSYNHAVPIKSF